MKQQFKIIVPLVALIISILLIIIHKSFNSKIAIVARDKSHLQLTPGSELIETTNNDGDESFNSKNFKFQNNFLFQFNENFNLNLIDKANPNNIEKINTKVEQDNMIINFEKPEDKGTNYEYVIKNSGNERKINFYSKSDINGYSYLIDNINTSEAPLEINKTDNLTILEKNINWSKDYYLHIRSFDKQGNYSENKTFKLDLPSNGVTVKYIDKNSNNDIERQENINGVANQEYDASNLMKQIEGYQLIETKGELQGELKKEKINIVHEYAKNVRLKIKYVDKLTGEELYKSKTLNGYEGKEIEMQAPDIEGYTCEQYSLTKVMTANDDILTFYYDPIAQGTVLVKYIDKDTNNEISDNIEITNYEGSEYWSEARNIEEYELNEIPNNSNGIIKEGTEEVIYYYTKIKGNNSDENNNQENIEESSKQNNNISELNNNQNKNIINIKCIDYDTKELIKTDTVKTSEEIINYKIKPIEGYRIMNADNFEDKSLIDELIQSLSTDKNFIKRIEEDKKVIIPKDVNENTICEYEILLDNDDSDYIIYYKK